MIGSVVLMLNSSGGLWCSAGAGGGRREEPGDDPVGGGTVLERAERLPEPGLTNRVLPVSPGEVGQRGQHLGAGAQEGARCDLGEVEVEPPEIVPVVLEVVG